MTKTDAAVQTLAGINPDVALEVSGKLPVLNWCHDSMSFHIIPCHFLPSWVIQVR